MRSEQLRRRPQEIILPQLVFETEQELWPHSPGIIFEHEAHYLIKELIEVLQPFLEEEQTLTSLAKQLNVGRMVYVQLTPPREGFTWFNYGGGTTHLIQVANWLPQDRKIKDLAHELSHAALGPRPGYTRGHRISGENRTLEIDRKHKIIERVCNWGAGFILSRIG